MSQEIKVGVQSGVAFLNLPNEIPRFYANNTEITFSTLDMSMVFGEIVGSNEKNEKVVQRVAKVTMSLEHAKQFMEALNRSAEAFEKAIGQPLPEIDISSFSASPSASPSVSPSASLSPSASISPSASASPSADVEDED